MQCSFCGETRYKRAWRPSQWTANCPRTSEFNCCKLCSDSSWLLPAPPGVSITIATPGVSITIAKEQLQHAVCLWRGIKIQWSLLVQRWMELSFNVRKNLSYYGCLHYLTPAEMKPWYDPGNHVYKCVLRIMLDNDNDRFLLGRYNWNEETCGDIIEGFLGFHYLRRKSMPEPLRSRVKKFALMIEALSLSVVYYCRVTNWADFYDFEAWQAGWKN